MLNNVVGLTPAKILENHKNKIDSYAVDVKTILKDLNISCFDCDFTSFNSESFCLKNFKPT